MGAVGVGLSVFGLLRGQEGCCVLYDKEELMDKAGSSRPVV